MNNNFKLIETDSYYFLIDLDNKATFNEYSYDSGDELHWKVKEGVNRTLPIMMSNKEDNFKIIAHLPKHNNTPVLEGVVLLPPIGYKTDEKDSNYTPLGIYKQEEDVEQAFEDFCDIPQEPPKTGKDFFIKGYKAASKNKWTDEDIKSAWDKFGDINNRPPKTKEELLQSLSLTLSSPVDFIPEYIIPNNSDDLNVEDWDVYWHLFEKSKEFSFYEDLFQWSVNEGKSYLEQFKKLKIVDNILQGEWVFKK